MLNNAAGMRRHMQTSENKNNRERRDWLWWAALCARIALGAAFLSGIADRFGLYRGRNVGYGDFPGFVRYTAKVNSFMPASTIPFLAWAATIAELFFGITLILGIWRVWAALGSAVLLILFGNRHGHFVRHQVAARLLRLLGIFGCAARCCVRESAQGVENELTGSGPVSVVILYLQESASQIPRRHIPINKGAVRINREGGTRECRA
jgi:uncharacterized membrane protein YphA (DoxX/SURF4 family)